MRISVRFEPHEEFLHCRASGEFNLKDACSMLHEVLVESAKGGATRVLVDCLQMGGIPTMLERYALAEFLARAMVELKTFPRMAFLGKEPLVDPNRFGELVARNRGVRMRAVEQMEDALKWLGGE